MKNYYFADPDYIDSIYGSESPVCIDQPEIERLASEWGLGSDELMKQFHVATTEEIAEYGVYNSEE